MKFITASKMHIVHLTTVHPPFDTRIFHKQAKTLVEAGYDVTLIAQHDRGEVVDGVKIIALPKPKNRFARILGLTWQAFRLALQQKADVYHFHDPELIPVGLALKALTQARVIYDVHEDYSLQILSKEWLPRPLRPILARIVAGLEGVATQVFDGVVTATLGIARRFPAEKTVMVQNFPLLSEFADRPPVPYTRRPPWVVYVGGLSVIRGVFEMVKAMSYLPAHLEAQLVLAGVFMSPELQDEVSTLRGWEKVRFLGWQTWPQVTTLLNKARAGLVVLHPRPNYLDAYPVKMFEYMAAGVPVVASDFPLWRQIIEETGSGLIVDPLDPQAIAETIAWLLEHPQEAAAMGERGRHAVLVRYNWKQEAAKLLFLYRRLLA